MDDWTVSINNRLHFVEVNNKNDQKVIWHGASATYEHTKKPWSREQTLKKKSNAKREKRAKTSSKDICSCNQLKKNVRKNCVDSVSVVQTFVKILCRKRSQKLKRNPKNRYKRFNRLGTAQDETRCSTTMETSLVNAIDAHFGSSSTSSLFPPKHLRR